MTTQNSQIDTPLVSIIVPMYNAEKFVEQTLRSALTQTHHNIEVVVIDDCSTDNSLKIVKMLSTEDKRIKVISSDKNHGGPAEPRNIGIKHSSGDYICFLDADDIWVNNKIEIQLDFMRSHNIDFCSSNKFDFINSTQIKDTPVNLKGKKLSYLNLLIKNTIYTSTVMMKRSLTENVRFNSDKTYVEDYLYWLDIFRLHKPEACKLESILMYYRKHANSFSQNKLDQIKKVFEIHKKQASYKPPLLVFIPIFMATYAFGAIFERVKQRFF